MTVDCVFMVYYPGCAQEQDVPFTFEHFYHVLAFQLVTVSKGQKLLHYVCSNYDALRVQSLLTYITYDSM